MRSETTLKTWESHLHEAKEITRLKNKCPLWLLGREVFLSSFHSIHEFPVVSKIAINCTVHSWSIGMWSPCHLCSLDTVPCSSQESPLVLQAGTRTGTFPIPAGFSLLSGFRCIWLPSPYCRGLTWPRISTQATARRHLSCLLPSHSLVAGTNR